jgi:hypothetical protein
MFLSLPLLASIALLNYTNNMRFETTIYKPNTYDGLLIKVLKFDTEEHFDYMKIDASGKTLALSSGHLVPYNISIDAPSVTVTFTSDMTTTYEGIELNVFAF